jgi:hypothetical protein
MAKEKVSFIGTTPKHLTREAREREFDQFVRNNKKLLKAIRSVNRLQNSLIIAEKAHE